MPIYEYLCDCGKEFDRYLPLSNYLDKQYCECGKVAAKVIRTPPLGFVEKFEAYDSPIDGRIISSKQQRVEDLARSGCIPYDPEMKKDTVRRQEEAQKKLEAEVDTFVEQQFESMDSRKKESLTAELQSGADINIERI